MENQERFSVRVVDDGVVSSFLTILLLEESDLFSRPLVFNDVDGVLQYVQENCLNADLATRIPKPQILLMDVNRPFKDGFALVGELQKLFPDLKERTTLYFITCSDYPRDKMKAEEIGVDGYLEQPLDNAHIHQITEAAKNKRMLIA